MEAVITMTCMECGAAMKTKTENHKYEASGLSGVTLLGVQVSSCPKCGDREVTIPDIEGLHRVIAVTLASKGPRLAPEEMRFLRKYLGLSSADFALHMGVTPETVSRWETGKTPMGATAERLLRMLVLTRQPVSHYPLDLFRTMATEDPKPLRVGMTADEDGWHPARRRERVPA